MIWLVLACLAFVALVPLAWSLAGGVAMRGRRGAALDLHRAQLGEIDRDLAEGRIGAPEHAVARLEIQRRLLAEDAAAEPAGRSSRVPLLVAMAVVPVVAVALYLPGAAPNLPAAPLAARLAQDRADAAQAQALADQLRQKIATLDPGSDAARQGYMLLGNLADTTGDLGAAADAWSQALAIRFDATLAAQVAEARSRVEGRVSPQSAALFRQALAAAPPDAPWRPVAEQRLASIPQAVP